MLTLDTPIRIGNFIYDRLQGGIRGGWDLRSRTVEAVISLAREQKGKHILGTLEKEGDRGRILPPPIVDSFSLTDSFPYDPALIPLFQKIHAVTEELERIIVANQHLAKKVFMVGEEEAPLTCTFIPSEAPGEFEEKEKTPDVGAEEPI